MIFEGNRLALERVRDSSARAALRTAADKAGELVQANDIAAAALLEAEPPLWSLLATAVRPPGAVNAIFVAAVKRLSPSFAHCGRTRTRNSFSPAALKAIDAFEAMDQEYAREGRHAGLDALILCVLQHLEPQDCEEWEGLDLNAATATLQDRLRQTQHRDGNDRDKPPLHIPRELAHAQDLTSHARTLGGEHVSPYAGEVAYERVFDILARALHRTSMHALVIGDRGVGQSALLLELARRSATGDLLTLGNKHVLLVDCRHTPPEQSRQYLVSLLNAVASYEDLVVCIDGFASLLRCERGATNLTALLAGIRRVQAKLLGLVSPREYDELLADDADLREWFTAINLPEPEGEVAIRLVSCYAAGLEEGYLVQIDSAAIRRAVTLTADYILHERLPGKAVRVLREACEHVAYERAQYGIGKFRVTPEDVVRAVAEVSAVPEETLRGVAEQGDYEESLAEEILGQEDAVREVASELGLIKAGLTDPGKPASVMLFVGQTGTGKTEMAKALARFYSRSKRLRTYTLGNFVEPHSVASIIGVPPGYVGHEQGGRIVTDLASDPYCVFLLDEADKAHPDVLQPFLNLFDEGWVCDQRGVKAYADKAIFILTTNVGQRMIGDMVRQGKSPEEMASRMKEALAQIRHGKSNRPVFAPEFLARIKRVVVFQPLDQDGMKGICRKLLRQMQISWREKRQKNLIVPDTLVDFIATSAHQRNEKAQGREGGRLVRKLMAEWIETPVQRTATAQPRAYRSCDAVVLAASIPEPEQEGQPVEPEVTVRFRQPDAAEAPEQGEMEHVASAT